MEDNCFTPTNSNLKIPDAGCHLRTPLTKYAIVEYDRAPLNSSKDNLSSSCKMKTIFEVSSNFEELAAVDNLYKSENRVLQTPLSDKSKFTNEGDKSFSSSSFKSREMISSTPIVNSDRKDYYKTPERKRKLFHCASSNYKHHSACFSLGSDSKYTPISSPTSSEKLKLHDCRFLNESSSIYFQPFDSSKSSPIIDCNKKEEESFQKTLHDRSLKSILDSSIINQNDSVSNKQTIFLNDSCNVNLKFESFDLLPGIKPLSDD